MTEISGRPASEQSGRTSSRPPRSGAAPVASASTPAKPAAWTPAAQITVAVSSARLSALLEGDAAGVDRGGAGALAHVDADRGQLAAGLRRQLRAEGGEHPLAGVEQDDARGARVDAGEVRA